MARRSGALCVNVNHTAATTLDRHSRAGFADAILQFHRARSEYFKADNVNAPLADLTAAHRNYQRIAIDLCWLVDVAEADGRLHIDEVPELLRDQSPPRKDTRTPSNTSPTRRRRSWHRRRPVGSCRATSWPSPSDVVAEVVDVRLSRPDENNSCRVLTVLVQVRPDGVLDVVVDREAYERRAVSLQQEPVESKPRRRRWARWGA